MPITLVASVAAGLTVAMMEDVCFLCLPTFDHALTSHYLALETAMAVSSVLNTLGDAIFPVSWTLS